MTLIHVDARRGQLADDLLALLDAGADRGVEVRFVDCFGEFRRKPGRLVGMAADDRQRRSGNLDPRTGESPFGHRVANRDDRAGVAAKIAHGGEPAARHLQRVGQSDGRLIGHRIFLA